MTPPLDEASQLAVVSSQIKDLKADFDNLRTELRDRDAVFVTKAEFEAWRTGIGREIGEVKTAQAQAAPRRTSGWTIAAAVGTILMGLVAVTTLIVLLIQVVPHGKA